MSDSVERKNTRRRCADSLRHSGTNLMSKWNMRKMSSCQRFTQENYPASFFANNESYWVVLVLKTSLFLRSQGFRNHPLTSIIIVVILWNWSVRFWWPSWIGCSHRYLKASVVCFIIMWSLYRLNSFTVKRRKKLRPSLSIPCFLSRPYNTSHMCLLLPSLLLSHCVFALPPLSPLPLWLIAGH